MRPMTKEQLADLLDGRQYGEEITSEEEKVAHDNGLVVIFGASDDLIEFRGILNDEIDSYGGCFFKFNKELDIKVGDKHHGRSRSVQAIWCPTDNQSWGFATKIPHSTFKVYEDGELYCVGLVINVAELP